MDKSGPKSTAVVASRPSFSPFSRIAISKVTPAYLVWLVLLIVLLPRLIEFGIHSWSVLTWEWQVDYDEGFNLSASWQLAQGKNIYAPPTPDRFVAAPYPPLYYLLSALFLKIFGLSMIGGRLISLVATLALAVFIGLLTYQFSRRLFQVTRPNSTLAAIAAGLIWLSLNPTLIWATFYKQDMLAMALAVGGLVVLARSDVMRWSFKNSRLYLCAGLLVAAFYTKQNELAVSAVAVLYLLLKNWRVGWKFAMVLGLMLVGPFLVLDVLTRHRFFYNVLEAQQVPWIWDDFWRRLSTRILPDHFVLVGLAVIFGAIVVIQAGRSWSKKRWYAPDLLTIWTASGVFTLITVGSYQSGYNHALDFFPPLIVVGMVVLAAAIELIGQKAWLGWLATLVVGAGLVVQTLNYPDSGYYYSSGNLPSTNRANMYLGLLNQIKATPGDILSEDIYLQLKSGRAVTYDDLYHMRLQAESGAWDEQQFVADLKARRFSLVLLGQGSRRFTDTGWEALNANYQLIFPDGLALWRPRPQPLTPQYSASCSVGEAVSYQGASYGRPDTTGKIWRVTTYWQISQKMAQNYVLFIHLVDANGKLLAQVDAPPAGWKVANFGDELSGPSQPLPTTSWQAGDKLLLDQSLPLPDGLKPDVTMRLEIGLYSLASEGNLSSLSANCGGQASDRIGLPPLK